MVCSESLYILTDVLQFNQNKSSEVVIWEKRTLLFRLLSNFINGHLQGYHLLSTKVKFAYHWYAL